MHVTIIKTGSTSLNVLIIYRRLTELMIIPVRERRDAFINTAGFHREMPVFRNIPKKEHRNIFFNFLLFFFSFLFFSFFVRANQVRHRSFKIFLNAFIYQDVVFFEHNTEIEGEKL